MQCLKIWLFHPARKAQGYLLRGLTFFFASEVFFFKEKILRIYIYIYFNKLHHSL